MIRKIIQIDEEKCNGCGLCVPTCAEGAIQIIDGKARLVKDQYCDGLGACLGECPQDALHIVEREAEEFDEVAATGRIENAHDAKSSVNSSQAAGNIENTCDAKSSVNGSQATGYAENTYDAKSSVNDSQATRHEDGECNENGQYNHSGHGHGHGHMRNGSGCPGSRMRTLNQEASAPEASSNEGGCPGSRMRTLNQEAPAPEASGSGDISFSLKSQLQQWPVQLTLAPIKAPYFENADLLITADCVPFAYPDYHPKLLKGKKVVIGCPKLDDLNAYIEKLTAIVKANDLNSITVAFMEVPCCSGIVYAAEQAVRSSGKNLKVNKVRISLDGQRQNL